MPGPPSRGRPRARLLAALALVFLASTASPAAHAQPPSPAPRPADAGVDLYVDPAITATDAEAVRAAVERDLGRPVRLVGTTPPGDGLRVVARGEGVAVAFRAGERLTERAVDLPKDPAARVETIALLAGNVVRDEASELLGELRPVGPPASATPPPKPPAPKPPAPPAPSPRSEPEKPAPPPIRCVEPKDADDWVGVDFVPYVGWSSARGARGTRVLSLNAVGGLSRAIASVEVSGVVGIATETACGLQLAGVVPYAGGSVKGLQLGGVANVAGGRVDGAQVAGVVDWATDGVRGLQFAGVANVAGDDVEGAQVGVVNVATGHARVQVGLVNVARTADAPIGLVSIVAQGKTDAYAMVSSWGLVGAGLRHGTGFVHNFYGLGAVPFAALPRGVVTAGIGITPVFRERLVVDVDALAHGVYAFDSNRTALVAELRVPIGLRLGERVTIWAAPSYDIAVSGREPEADLGNVAVDAVLDGPSTYANAFPAVSAGVTVGL